MCVSSGNCWIFKNGMKDKQNIVWVKIASSRMWSLKVIPLTHPTTPNLFSPYCYLLSCERSMIQRNCPIRSILFVPKFNQPYLVGFYKTFSCHGARYSVVGNAYLIKITTCHLTSISWPGAKTSWRSQHIIIRNVAIYGNNTYHNNMLAWALQQGRRKWWEVV